MTKTCQGCGALMTKRPKASMKQWNEKKFCTNRCWQSNRTTIPVSDRLWARVEKTDGCWLWTGATTKGGYGVIGKPGGGNGNILTHVAAYLELVGPIPDGFEVDHLCRVTACCRPDHLEAVTKAENLRRQAEARKTCIHGHELTPENTYHPPQHPNRRMCRRCTSDRHERYKRERAVAS